eukprot:TRINITY_DN8386_c0_g1_i1.p1 TRINITY_DN8386_c0_g1~~TRINITY_DN8386_c0_g1_i1.p1  ORF type:complete len:525 (-),score=108.81 TRINITY_DN8386_c0_g1_i1:639-2213(-)
MEPGVTKQGNLFKEGGKLMDTWQKRWCVIKGSDFQYFKKQGAKEMQGSIALKTCKEIKAVGVYKKKKDVFTIVTQNKTYFLYAEGDSCESWVKALNDGKGGDDQPAAEKPKEPVASEKPSETTTTKPTENKIKSPPTAAVKCEFDTTKYELLPEIMVLIFSWCSPRDLAQAACANKQWKALTGDDLVWRKLFERLPGAPVDNKKSELSWKEYYKEYQSNVDVSLEVLTSLKNIIPFLREEGTDSKILEFHQIWTESFPDIRPPLWGQKKRQLKLFVSSDFLQISWYMGGTQAEFIQGMVDFFWNVGAPESEIDKLNDVGALCNPSVVGSWIDMSKKGGMDGGWFFPVDIPIAKALEAADKGHEAFKILKGWAEKNAFLNCYHIKRDMGAAPPRQTELKFKLVGSFEQQCKMVKEALQVFGFPEIPKDKWDILTEQKLAGIRLSVIVTDEGFARVGVLFPHPSASVVRRLCTGDKAVLEKLEGVLRAPTFVEFFNLNAGFGYGVYMTGPSIGFHYCVNGPDSHHI